MKKHNKLANLLLISILLMGLLPAVSAYAAVAPGEIEFKLTTNASISEYALTDVDVGPSSVGYSAINISYPAELYVNYKNTPLSSANKPPDWTITSSTGAGGITNVSILITRPNINGMEANLESFLGACTFTLKAAGVYPQANSIVTVMISEQSIVQFTDENGGMHVYEFVEYSQQVDKRILTWLEAYNAARARSFFGHQGHLATLTSIDEQFFVYSTIAQRPGWLGGTTMRYASTGNPMIDGTTDISTNISDYTSNRSVANAWYWTDGPEATDIFYNRAVRDDSNGPVPGVFNFFSNRWTYDNYPEYRTFIQNGNEPNGDGGECCLQFAWSSKASWNDLRNDSTLVQGYYVEYDFPEGLSSSTGVAAAEFLVPITIVFEVGNSAYTGTIAKQTVWIGDLAMRPDNFVDGYRYAGFGNRKFLGWYEDPALSVLFDFTTPITAANSQGSTKTLYGKWEQYHYVSFDINNLSFVGAILTQVVASGGFASAPQALTAGTIYNCWNGYQYEQKQFMGWFRPGQDPSNGVAYDFSTDAVTVDITLHAEWQSYYSVVFQVNNPAYVGAPLIATQCVATGDTASIPSELSPGNLYPAYGNKQFISWYDDPAFGTPYNFSTPITADTTLTARWQQYYSVTFVNTRNNSVPAQAVVAGGLAAAPDSSAWSDLNFTFYGWSANSTDDYTNFTAFDFNEPISADTVLYGLWDPVIYSLCFDANGGSWSGNITPQTREYCPGADDPHWDDFQPTDIPPTPQRPGYHFNGWQDGGGSAPPDRETVILANNTYYAQWGPEIYQIYYELHGGRFDAANPNSYSVENTSFPISISDPLRDGYTFLGWQVRYANPTLSSSGDPMSGFSILQGVTGDIRLEAIWSSDEYAIFYDLDGGADPLVNPYSYTVENSLTFAAPVKFGYAFLGWTISGGMNTTLPDLNLSIPLGTMGDLYLTAHWSDPIVYGIVYQLDGGTLSLGGPSGSPLDGTLDGGLGNPSSYTVNDTFTLDVPTRLGYTFVGWTVSGGLNWVIPKPSFVVPIGTTGDLVFVAHWQKFSEDDPPPPSPLPPGPSDLPPTGSTSLPIGALLLLGLSLASVGVIQRNRQRTSVHLFNMKVDC